jgi:DNA repair photolyase
VGIVTKSPLIERDLPLLLELAAVTSVQVSISVPFFDEENARAVEPYVATPARRFRTIERLASAGIAVGVNIAPVIPGLSDEDIPRILTSARQAGARRAHMGLLRLPGSVKDVFSERIRAAFPLRAEKILARIRDTRAGAMNDPRFGARHEGTGEYADVLHQLFRTHLARLGMNVWEPMSDPAPSAFRRPTDTGGQLRLFDSPTR